MTDRQEALTVAAHIAAGEYDEHLDTFAAAIVKRLVDGHATGRWKIDTTVGDHPVTVTEDDLTLGEMAAIEFRTGRNWTVIDPRERATDAQAILTVRLISEGVKDAEKQVAGLPANTFVECLSTYTVTPDPKDTPASP
jgi:hypothetical protein